MTVGARDNLLQFLHLLILGLIREDFLSPLTRIIISKVVIHTLAVVAIVLVARLLPLEVQGGVGIVRGGHGHAPSTKSTILEVF